MLLGAQRRGTYLGTRKAHFEQLHMSSLHTGTVCVAPADEEEALEHRAGLAAGLAPASATQPVRLGAGFALALGAGTNFFGGAKSLGILRILRGFSSHMSRGKYNFPSNTRGMFARHAQCATFVVSIKALAPSLSSPREDPQVDCTGPQTFPAKHVAQAEI